MYIQAVRGSFPSDGSRHSSPDCPPHLSPRTLGNNISAPLRSVIFLNRGINNTYQKVINKQEIYINLLSQIYLPKEKDKREKALKVVDTILKRTYFYIINVNKDLDAAIMTYERIIKDETK